ncbi:MAG: hypothetical protein IPK26_12145 [Planctomycetes bacterium]|nr:hypothetical protein [Planctomycetota bacterium]
MVGPQLEAIAEAHEQIWLRRVDIGSWQSAAARQHGINRLPTIWLYENGRLYSKDREQISQRLQKLMDGGRR